MQNLFAHTDLGHDYPAYLSINKDDDGRHRVSVRSAGNGGRDLGEIHVSPEVLEHMATEVIAKLNGEAPAEKSACERGDACCGKCHAEPEAEAIDWRARYLRDVEGLNNEGDPIGGEPAMGLRQVAEHQRAVIQDLAQRLQSADAVIIALVQAAGGSVTITGEQTASVVGHMIESSVSEDKSAFTFRAVPVPPQVAQ